MKRITVRSWRGAADGIAVAIEQPVTVGRERPSPTDLLAMEPPGCGRPSLQGATNVKKMQRNDGFTLIELLIVVAIIAIIAAIAVPNYMSVRVSGYETSAIGSVRIISSAQVAFAASCGGGGSAADLATGTKAGYVLTISNAGSAQVMAQGATCNSANNSYAAFFASAAPVTPGTTGVRYFATDQTGLIKQSKSSITPANFDAADFLQ